MYAKALRPVALTRSGLFALALASATSGCGATRSEEDVGHSAEVAAGSSSEVTSPGTTTAGSPSGELVAGGVDSVGGFAEDAFDTSPNGSVTTTLGTYLVGVRSDVPVGHVFQEAGPGAPELVFLHFSLRTEDGRQLDFEFEYSEGRVTRPIIGTSYGYLGILEGEQQFNAVDGAVTIEPMSEGRIELSFEQVVVAPLTVDAEGVHFGARELIGNGVVEGPVRRSCSFAADYAVPDPQPPTPAPVHDSGWIRQFCGGASE